jgi:glucose/arabinose dehydrogenase
MNMRTLAAIVLIVPALAACGAATSGTPTATPLQEAPAATLAPSAAPTQTPSPTATSEPTASPASATETAQPSAEPTAEATVEATPEATTPAPEAPAGTIALETVASGFKSPLYVADDGSGRLYVVEKAGRIMLIDGDAPAEAPFLDIQDRVGSSSSERGLLSVAFHPKYAENGFLYVDYTDKSGDTVVSRFSAQGGSADPASEKVLLQVDQPYPNHNGGLVLFGPDGYLYIGLGDGGSGGDPQNRAQNRDELLGKILRIDVDGGDPYAIPADNPWTSGDGRPEIWAFGLRNPWRFSFDRETGDMLIGDVGQNKIEEIDFQPAGQGGQNYGWNQVEGDECYKQGCDQSQYVAPVAQYTHADGCSVTGGYVYRGTALPALQGTYFYGDYCQGTIWELRQAADGSWQSAVALESRKQISSFGQDSAGELYLTDLGDGTVFHIVEKSEARSQESE